MAQVALGVTGGIGAYKAVEVARGLQKAGHDVVAVMTRSARRFVGEVTFEAITRRRVITGLFTPGTNAEIEHIAIASSIDLLVVAPATAHTIGKFANGLADDFLSSLYLATRAPVLLAPAMNTQMWEHPAVRRNIATLTDRGVQFVEPAEGYLACGWIGKGRLAEPDVILRHALDLLGGGRTLAGWRVLVTAGPTYEDLDPVRYLGNRSSGRMGFAVAAEAAKRGARVVLVAGPTTVEPPKGPELVRVRSAADMHAAVMARVADTDCVIMAAAVADYTPAGGARTSKHPKSGEALALELRPTVDILADLGRWRGPAARPLLVGFAAETGDPAARAREKLRTKRVDLIVANDVSRPGAGFEVDTNEVTFVSRDGDEKLPCQPKAVVAGALLDRVEAGLARLEPAVPPHS
jgi:phosphopantothenoylcysteine decarboxylase/phosphopantothenate--cysteine ligase